MLPLAPGLTWWLPPNSGLQGQEAWIDLELKLVADVGIIGCPNAGKSTLLRCGLGVYAGGMLGGIGVAELLLSVHRAWGPVRRFWAAHMLWSRFATRSVVSAAKPKIANYPFTTLVPNLGVCNLDYRTTVFAGALNDIVGSPASGLIGPCSAVRCCLWHARVSSTGRPPRMLPTPPAADVPGLLEGAHAGVGLGHQFLRHCQRCRVLVHVVDGTRWAGCRAAGAGAGAGSAASGVPHPQTAPKYTLLLALTPALLLSLPMCSPDPMGDYRAIRQELELFNPLLATKPQVGHTGSLATVLQGLLQLLPHLSA